MSEFDCGRRVLLWALVAGGLAAGSVAGAAAGESALTLSRAGGAETVELTLGELAVLPAVTVVTEHEFADGAVAYRGPLVRDVLAKLGLDDAETVRFTAANDYYVDIPTGDFEKYDAILAMEADGKRLSRRDRGPLWLIYPISDHPELRDPIFLHRLIWQVIRIESL